MRNGIIWVLVLVGFQFQMSTSQVPEISRKSFPEDFVFGTASSAFQYEGAVKEDGRGPTVWDKFSHSFGKIIDFSNADFAVDQYHRYNEDIQLMKDMGMDAYRFSIAWSRIFPNGSGEINQAGIDHYNNLINALLAKEFFFIYAIQSQQHGALGISLNVIWFEPISNSTEDIEATQRAQDFQLGWFLDPLIFGDYPSSMKKRVGSRLPTFSKAEGYLVKGSLDFVGINHYTTFYAKSNTTHLIGFLLNDTNADSGAVTLPFKSGHPIGERASSIWLYLVPEGIRSLMNYIKDKYGNPLVIITENGMDDPNNPFISIKDALQDTKRIKYHSSYLSNLLASIKEDGCNVRGYFAWSLLDNWEWAAGYTSRFGLYFVDYKDNLKRYPKQSVQWFKNFLTS
ncbi:hypothetical protein NE237_019868 [Protea cynaroides]|uniref:Beta-glucosidase n=1 Tax=Protea cynaroides TaxID=273540 RepID=A0A9Q0K3C4_9MAGN|nr:hypothetical protein NE237_019868 [Protea cynaroides]